MAAILSAKEQGIGAILVLAAVVPAADIMAVRLQNSNRRNDVRHYRPVHLNLLDFAGLSSNFRLHRAHRLHRY